MNKVRLSSFVPLICCAMGCQSGRKAPPPSETIGGINRDHVPIALNADSVMTYPSTATNPESGGRLVLRLVVDSGGKVMPDSITVRESSGDLALDSAGMKGALNLRYAPAMKNGRPITTAVLQPITFRPQSGLKGQ